MTELIWEEKYKQIDEQTNKDLNYLKKDIKEFEEENLLSKKEEKIFNNNNHLKEDYNDKLLGKKYSAKKNEKII